jgi:oxygen-dependent protoporphyrinogen oxidase
LPLARQIHFEGADVSAKKAVIVGGGFAGLTAGYQLRKAGWEVTLLEAADEVGGRVRTVRKQGYTFDTGATQMSSGYREYLALLDELGMGDQMVESSPYVGLLRHGRVHVIDGRSLLSGALTSALSIRSKFVLLKTVRDALAVKPPLDVLDVSRSHFLDVESAAEYSKRRLNDEIYDVLVDAFVRTYVMNRGDRVSALEWFSALKNLGGEKLLSLKGGNDVLPKRLARDLDVHLKTRATAVNKVEGGVEVEAIDATGTSFTLTADACVLATRLPEAMDIYPPAREMAGALAEKLRYNRAWVVQLGYAKQPASKAVGVLLGTVEQPEITLLWQEHMKNNDRAPAGHSLFSVYSDEAANDEWYGRSDEELIALATRFVERLHPELKGHQDATLVTRWPMAIPNPSPGVYKALFAMKQRLNPADSVQLAGDYFTCTGQNSAIHYGKRAAENILEHHSAHSTMRKHG